MIKWLCQDHARTKMLMHRLIRACDLQLHRTLELNFVKPVDTMVSFARLFFLPQKKVELLILFK